MSNAIDFFPILRYLPNKITARGRKLNQEIINTWGGLVKQVELEMHCNKEVPPSLTKKMLKLLHSEERLSHKEMAMLAAAFMIGGVETVSAYCAFSGSF